MLNLKKVIALVCVFAMVLTTVAFGATYSDVAEDSAYYEAVETLNKLGIITGYEDGTFKPEDGVTRAEMAALIARIQGYGETAKPNANTAFTDVPASHWASGYIANASGMGIINGYGDGTFGPEDPVLYEQAVKMVMATLGYTPFAEKNGGYPTGYLAAAQRYNVSLAVANAAVGQEANRGTVAQLLENALDTPLMVQAGWNTNGEVEYKIAEGELTTEYVYDASMNSGSGGYYPVTTTKGYKTLMSENLGFVKIRGILYANDVTNVYNTKNIDTTEESKVWISVVDDYGTENKKFASKANNEYLVGDVDVDGLLGRSVIAYVKANVMDDFEILSITVDTNRNEELVIALDQFANYSTSNDEISYYKDGDSTTTEVDCEAGLSVVYNGVGDAAASYPNAVLNTMVGANCKFGGQITLIDNDEVNGFDVAIVDKAATGVVKKVTEDGIAFWNNVALYGGNTKSIEVDVDDETKVVAIYKDGEEIDYTELAEYDVLSIYAVAENSNLIVADVVANSVVGTITSKKASKTSANNEAYKVADEWYDLATGVYTDGAFDVAEGGTFYIDEFGKIAAFIEDSALAGGSAANYAYVYGVSAEPADFGSNGIDVKIQLVTADGVKIMPLKSNARVEVATPYDHDSNGSTPAIKDVDLDIADDWADDYDEDSSTPGVQTNDKFDANDKGYAEYNTIVANLKNQVVQYVANGSGYITKLTEAAHDTDKFNTSSFGTGSAVEFDADNSKFMTTAGYVDSDALVFIIDYTDVANCKIGTLADLDHENTYKVDLAYTDKKAEDTSVIVVDYSTIKSSTTSSLAVVIGAGQSTNEDGEEIWSLVYMIDGEEVEANTTADVAVGALPTEGDIIKVKVGSEGLITDIKVVFDFTTNATYSIRDFATNYGAATAVKNSLVDSTKEKFYGGVVTNFKDTSSEATIETQVDSNNDGLADTTETITVKLSRAANAYLVDANGRSTVIKNGSDGSFKFFEKLYDTNLSTVAVEVDDVIVNATATRTVAQAYADHIYVRMYDGKPTDIVIVKGLADLKIK